MTQSIQQQYIKNLHDSFVKYINDTLAFIAGLLSLPNATEADRKVFNIFKEALLGEDVKEVEQRLTEMVIRRSTLDKLEKVHKDLVDLAVDHLHESPLIKQFWKNLSHAQIELAKQTELQRLKLLNIPLAEE